MSKSVYLQIWTLACLLVALNGSVISLFDSNAFGKVPHFQWGNKCGDRVLAPAASQHLESKRLIGGDEAVPNSWPFVASIGVERKGVSRHHCGATIISDMHVLTAAHCIIAFLHMASKYSLSMPEMRSMIKVSVGRHHSAQDRHSMYDENNSVYDIETLDFHANFNFSEVTIDNDVMIFKLKRKIIFDSPNVNMACLPDPEQTASSLRPGHKVIAVGWGATESRFDYAYAETLQQAVFTVMDPDDIECNSGLVGAIEWNKKNNVCAAGLNKVSCFGDSGGPVFQYIDKKWTLVGIISFGNDIIDFESQRRKCDPTRPFYFADVSVYVDWIQDRIKSL